MGIFVSFLKETTQMMLKRRNEYICENKSLYQKFLNPVYDENEEFSENEEFIDDNWKMHIGCNMIISDNEEIL